MVGIDFYTTSAQVIPVLLLTLILERGFLRRDKGQSPVDALWWRSFITLTLVAGEAAALAGAAGATGVGYARLTVIAIGAGGFAIVSGFLFESLLKTYKDVKKRKAPLSKGARIAFPATMLLTVLTGFAPFLLAVWVAYVVL